MVSNGSDRANGHAPLPPDAAREAAGGPEDMVESPPTVADRITVTLPDGTMLTLIGVPRLLIAAAGGIGTGSP
jgi:hypothetical protein